MRKLIILSLISISLSSCSFWTATRDTAKYRSPECPPVPECNITTTCLTPEDMRCLAKQKQAYKSCIWVHEQSWELFNTM